MGQAGATALTDFALSGGFKALGDIKESKQAASVGDPVLKESMAFDIEKPELGLQRSLGEKNFLTSGPLTREVSLSDTIPSDLSTDSSRAILSDASSISSQAPEAQFPLRFASPENVTFVREPSLFREEYALARDSLNTQRRMEALSRRLGIDIARREGRLGQVLPNQDIRNKGLMDLGIDSIYPVNPYFNLPMRNYAGGGLFNPMKTGRRIF